MSQQQVMDRAWESVQTHGQYRTIHSIAKRAAPATSEANMNHPDLTELQRRSEQRRKALQQAAKRTPTLAERQAWRIMFRAALLGQRDRERGLL